MVITKLIIRGLPKDGAPGGYPYKTERTLEPGEGGYEDSEEEIELIFMNDYTKKGMTRKGRTNERIRSCLRIGKR